MASINLSGILREPLGEFSGGNKVRFTHKSATGQTLINFQSHLKIEEDGSYDIDIQYGNVFIESWDGDNNCWTPYGIITINSDTPATSLPALLGATTPVTDEDLLLFQTLVEDAYKARDEAQAAQAIAQAAQAIAEAARDETLAAIPAVTKVPDLFIPFNEGGEIERGYGTFDSNGNRAVNFSRASSSGQINKSGELSYNGPDEPIIENYGIGVFQSFTNIALWSEVFSDATWQKTGSTTVSQDGTLSPDGVSQAWLVDFGGIAGQVKQIIASSQQKVISSCFIMGTKGETIKIESRAVNSSVFSQPTITLTGKWQRIDNLSFDADWPNQTDAFVYASVRKDSVNTANQVYIWAFQVQVNDSFIGPYMSTSSSAISRSSDVCSYPARNNLPAQGESFSIMLDTNIGPHSDVNKILLSLGSLSQSGLIIAVESSGLIFGLSNGSGFVFTPSYAFSDDTQKRIVADYDADSETIGLYVDGNLIGNRASISGPIYDINDDIYIGSNSGSSNFANSEIKNVRTFFSDGNLTPDEIKAWGGIS